MAREKLGELGPGIVTGAANDDPSGISTYTIAGAALGYQLLWTSVVTLPMIIVLETISARIGLVRREGLARVIADRYDRRLLGIMVFVLFVTNVISIGADILAVAAAVSLLVPLPTLWIVVPIGVGIAVAEVVVAYSTLARYLKILTMVIFVYVIAAFASGADWGLALKATVWPPQGAWTGGAVQLIVAILGTQITPFLFFWQATEEFEEEREADIDPGKSDHSELSSLMHRTRLDVGAGMVVSNLGLFFVIVTAAATLHATGQTQIQTAAQVASALQPIAGSFASVLFALGLIGTGLLAIPTLASSVAYATAELFDWPEGLSQRLRRAPQFYSVIVLATLIGLGITFTNIGEIRALYLAAILNGLVAPLFLAVVMLLAGDRSVLGEYTAGKSMLIIGWVTTAVMTLASAVLLFGLF